MSSTTAHETTTARLANTVKTRAAATRWIKAQGGGSFDVREAAVAGPFGGIEILELTVVCTRSRLVPARCACSAHATLTPTTQEF